MNIAELSFTHYTQTIVTLNTTFLKHELQGLKVSLPVCCATIYLVYREWNFDAFFLYLCLVHCIGILSYLLYTDAVSPIPIIYLFCSRILYTNIHIMNS